MNRSGTGRRVLRAALMTLIIASTLGQGAAATAKSKPHPHKHGADLIISHLAVDAGTPPYIVVGTDGTLTDFSIDVTVENHGDRTSHRSHLKLWIYQAGVPSRRIAVEYAVIPRLTPRERQPVTFDVPGLRPSPTRLDPIWVGVKANYNLVAPETNYHNNHATSADIPVIAREWKVINWSTHSVSTVFGSGGSLTVDSTDDALPGMVWKFSGFDSANQIFTYRAEGGINQDTKVSSPPCSGAGVGTATGPWSPPDSQFSIDYAVARYGATLYTKGEKPYTVSYTCTTGPGGSTTVPFADLETYGPGPPPQSYPYGARRLSGSGTIASGFTTLNYTWQFDADVP